MVTIQSFTDPRLASVSSSGSVPPLRHLGALLAGRLAPSAILAPFREYWRRERVRHELSLLNDRELSDIRMTRQEISEIFKPEFAASRAADRV
ncbi:MAG: DUF1127 domain-containing protein [Acetobacteraceae bacterium]